MQPPENSKLPQRFWDKVEVNPQTRCWEWNAGTSAGYGMFRLNYHQPMKGTHRLVYEDLKGPLNGCHALHICDIRKCCNPDHLYAGNNHLNQIDAWRRHRRKQGKVNLECRLRGEDASNKLTENDVHQIRDLIHNGTSIAKVSVQFNISKSQVARIADGESWSHVPNLYGQRERHVECRNKLIREQAEEIRKLTSVGELTMQEIGHRFNVSTQCVKRIKYGKS